MLCAHRGGTAAEGREARHPEEVASVHATRIASSRGLDQAHVPRDDGCMSYAARALALALVATSVATAPVAKGSAPRIFSLAIHAVPGVAEGFVAERLATANTLFEPAGVRFRLGSTRPLDPRHALLVSRSDRDALGAYHSERAIDVFVVDGLVDVDTPPLPRRGVHWRDRTRPGVRYVIVIAGSSPWVLPHELGHYFGLGHSDVVGNLMSYSRGDGDPFLDETQLARIRGRARRLARAQPSAR